MPASPTDPAKDAALMVDGETGKVLYSRNANAQRHPASLTKMMTLYLLFDALKKGQLTLSSTLPVSAHAAAQHPTKLHLYAGDTIPVDSAIYAIVIRSANDVAVAIAEALGGTEGHFAEMMNVKARQLGMRDTFYHNASGLPDPLQISTASDLAILARHLAYDFPQYYHYFGAPGFTYRGVAYTTHDNLIGRYQGADGIKTGYTGASGFNLVSSVVRGRTHIIGVVMGGRTAHRRDNEMMRLLDNTFAQIQQNPTLVASARVPWQNVAQNTQTVVAGFDLTGPSRATQAQAAANDGAEDEDAAETQSDENDAIEPETTVVTAAPPAPVPQPALPRRAAPPPPPAQTAVAALNNAPTPSPKQTVVAALGVAKQTAVALNVPTPSPKPKHDVVLASLQPGTLKANPLKLPVPRPTARPESGEGDYGDDIAAQARKLTAKDWTIQIGAFADSGLARAQLANYAERSMDILGQAARIVVPFKGVDGQMLFRARFGPFVEREAREVCARLTERGQTCFAALATR
ncbi:MAG: D-alanyl-D-alanine carboxypeptidase [Alphaproteobacteria bacterium]|nr:D-alanyl-D-alanine carboxypeptidase [Alphaproteobacteria bacterium]